MAGFYDKQIKNRNFLAPTGFRFSLIRAPKIAFFCNSANIPDIQLGTATQSSYLKDIDVPGDKLQFGDLNIKFLVDEDLKNYMELQNWMRGLGYPEKRQEIFDLQELAPRQMIPSEVEMNIYSDASLLILTSNNNINFKVKFKGLFPTYLSTLEFDATDNDVEYFTADATFKYTLYTITDENDNRL